MINLIHFIWIGSNKLSDEFSNFIKKWEDMYPQFKIKLWSDEMIHEDCLIPEFLKQYYYDNSMKHAFKVDILRYLILNKYGGLYIDVDFEPLKIIPKLFFEFDFFGAIQPNKEVAIGLIYSKPNSELLNDVIFGLKSHLDISKNNNQYNNGNLPYLTGPTYFNSHCKKYFNIPNYYFFTQEYFYPYWCEEMHRRKENFKETSPLAYAVHHWNASWLK